MTIIEDEPVRLDYRFDGWAFGANLPASVKPGDLFTWPDDHQEMTITLYAAWTYQAVIDHNLPQTGDPSAPVAWAALLLLSVAAIAVTAKGRRRGQ